MDRRESIKSLLVGSLAGGTLISGCATPETSTDKQQSGPTKTAYGRTPQEKLRDQRLFEANFFTAHELATVAVLCDLILPAEGDLKSAGEADVPAFIDFIVKDMPRHQLPIRGGVMWLDNFANESFGKPFESLSKEQQKSLLDQIAFPLKAAPHLSQGVAFFSLMRNLTLTGFYTSKEGVEELGYIGNVPNIWDGVPEDVLKEHGLSYEKEWLVKCIDQDKRMDVAKWDDNMNLIS